MADSLWVVSLEGLQTECHSTLLVLPYTGSQQDTAGERGSLEQRIAREVDLRSAVFINVDRRRAYSGSGPARAGQPCPERKRPALAIAKDDDVVEPPGAEAAVGENEVIPAVGVEIGGDGLERPERLVESRNRRFLESSAGKTAKQVRRRRLDGLRGSVPRYNDLVESRVSGDEQIEASVAVEIEQQQAETEAADARHTGLFGDVDEMPRRGVPVEKDVLTPWHDEKVDTTVAVAVAEREVDHGVQFSDAPLTIGRGERRAAIVKDAEPGCAVGGGAGFDEVHEGGASGSTLAGATLRRRRGGTGAPGARQHRLLPQHPTPE